MRRGGTPSFAFLSFYVMIWIMGQGKRRGSKSKDIYHVQAEFCRSINHPIRLMIIEELADGELTVSEIAERVSTPIPTVSQHLKVLYSKGVLEKYRDGNRIYYSLKYPEVIEALKLMRGVLQKTLEDKVKYISSM